METRACSRHSSRDLPTIRKSSRKDVIQIPKRRRAFLTGLRTLEKIHGAGDRPKGRTRMARILSPPQSEAEVLYYL